MEKKARKIIRDGHHAGNGGRKATAKESRGMRAIPGNDGVDVEGEFLLDLLESEEDCDLRR